MFTFRTERKNKQEVVKWEENPQNEKKKKKKHGAPVEKDMEKTVCEVKLAPKGGLKSGNALLEFSDEYPHNHPM